MSHWLRLSRLKWLHEEYDKLDIMNHFRQKTLFAILVLALGVNLVAPKAWSTDNACIAQSLSQQLQGHFTPEGTLANETRLKLEKKLNRHPQLQMEVQRGKALPQQLNTHSSIAVVYESGSKLGSLAYHFERDVLIIDGMKVDSNYQRLGIGSALFEAVIKMNPHIRQIQTVLAEDNDKALYEALTQRRDLESAILKTPAYKIRARLGFTRIVPGSIRDTSWDGSGTYQFAVERP